MLMMLLNVLNMIVILYIMLYANNILPLVVSTVTELQNLRGLRSRMDISRHSQ